MDRNRPEGKAMQTAIGKEPDTDALLSELGVLYPLVTFTGAAEDASPADAWEAPSATSTEQGTEERRSEMDERIMAGMVRA
jgi:hypothetical protein